MRANLDACLNPSVVTDNLALCELARQFLASNRCTRLTAPTLPSKTSTFYKSTSTF